MPWSSYHDLPMSLWTMIFGKESRLSENGFNTAICFPRQASQILFYQVFLLKNYCKAIANLSMNSKNPETGIHTSDNVRKFAHILGEGT